MTQSARVSPRDHLGMVARLRSSQSSKLSFLRFAACCMLVVVVALCFAPSPSEAIVGGIDFGTEWIKIALVRPARPIDIVENEMTKRKSPSGVSFRADDEKVVGEGIAPASVLVPRASFVLLPKFFGRDLQSAEELATEQFLPIEMKKNEFGRLSFVLRGVKNPSDEGKMYSLTELCAIMFEYIEHITSKYAQAPVRDFVVAVPASFGIEERTELLNAAKVAGIRILSFVTDGTAAAIQYGIMKKPFYDKKEKSIIILDSGASLSQACVATYFPGDASKPDSGKVRLRRCSWDSSGGLSVDAILLKHFASKFEKESGLLLRDFPSSYPKLRKGVRRLKEILSANSEHTLSIESIARDIDYTLKMTREELEKLILPEIDRSLDVISRAVEGSGVGMDNIEAIELIGGSMRIPLFQSRLQERFSGMNISFSLNADEAIALGSAFFAAKLSPRFQVRSFAVEDTLPFEYFAQLTDPASGSKLGEKKVFPHNVRVGARKTKTVDLPSGSDLVHISCSQSALGKKNSASRTFEVSGLSQARKVFEAAAKKEDIFGVPKAPQLRIVYQVNEFGEFLVESSNVIFSYQTLSAAPPPPPPPPTESVEKTPSSEADANSTDSSDAKSDAQKKDESKNEPPPPPSPKTHHERVSLRVTLFQDVPTVSSPEEIVSYQHRLQKLEEAASKREMLGAARNALEGYIIESKQVLNEESINQVSKEEERELCRSQLDAADDWMWEESERASVDLLREKLQELGACVDPLRVRRDEWDAVPTELRKLEEFLKSKTSLISQGRALNVSAESALPGSVNELDNLLNETLKSIQEWDSQYSKADPTVSLSFSTKDIARAKKRVDESARRVKGDIAVEEKLSKEKQRQMEKEIRETLRKMEEERKAREKAEAAAKEAKSQNATEETKKADESSNGKAQSAEESVSPDSQANSSAEKTKDEL